jgi:hypothetical protein
MKKAELILGAVCIIAVIMSLSRILFAGPLLVVSFGTLAILYMFLSYFIFNNIRLRNVADPGAFKGISVMKAIGTVGLGQALAITLMGILFKIMSWPGAGPMMIPGLIFLTIILIIAFIRYSGNKYYITIFKRIAIIGGAGLILFSLPNYAILDFKYRNYPS